MSKGVGAVIHGVVGIGAVLVMGLRSCDDLAQGGRYVNKIPTSSVGKSYDDIYQGANDSISSLNDVLSGNANKLGKSVTAEDNILMLAARRTNNMELEKTLPGEHIHYSNIDNMRYADIDSSWFEAVESPKIVSLFPATPNQYKNIYGRSPSVAAESKLKNFNEQINAEPYIVKRNKDQADLILKSIEDADGSPIVILAHSEDGGRKVVFPDGTSMDVTKVHAKCIEALKRCMMLTCHGDDFGITENITASEALSIWKSVSSLANNSDNKVTVSDLILEARTVRSKQKARKKIIIAWATASVIGPFLKTSLHTEDGD